MERTLRRISPGSVFKVSFVVYAIIMAIFGCLFLLLPGLLLGGSLIPFMDQNDILGATGGALGLIIGYVLLVVLGGLFEAVIMAIAAAIYNLVAGWVGGIRYTSD